MSLLTSLISYWSLDERSGDAVDLNGTNTLIANSAPGSAPGSAAGQLALARTFNGSNQLFAVASNAGLQSSNGSISLQSWVKFNSLSSAQVIAGKWSLSSGREYRLIYDLSSQRVLFQVSSNGTSAAAVSSDSFGAISTGAWYHLLGWHDADTDIIGISVNGIINTASHTDGIFSGAGNFTIGNSADQALWANGSIDEVCFWKRALTNSERDTLYNRGDGWPYQLFGKQLLPNANPRRINGSLIT